MKKVADPSKFILNCLPSREQEKDWMLDTAAAVGTYKGPEAIPKSVDLRADWWKIGQQGSTGSCVGWGAADGVLRWHFVKEKMIAEDEPLSVRYLWMAAKETDQYTFRPTTFIEQSGTWCKAALDVAHKYGVVKDSVLPFFDPQGGPELYSAGDPRAFYALASRLRISCYYNLGGKPADWRSWLANNGPILTRLEVDATWNNATSTDGLLKRYDANHTDGGHCVVLVGYTNEHFIVRNSWGPEWGKDGFAFATDKYAEKAFSEAYGVVV